MYNHPDKDFVAYIFKGIKQGFRIGVNSTYNLISATKNMHSAALIHRLNKSQRQITLLVLYCSTYSVTTSFPLSEAIQISLGFPDRKEFTLMPCLRMVPLGIQHCIFEQDSRAMPIRLSITPTILLEMRDYWLPKSA